MELLQLKYFQVIARTQNISHAATELHIAQPSLSQTLKRLETELGTSLFDRKGKHIILNEYGRIFLKYTNKVFDALAGAAIEIDTLRHREQKNVVLYIRAASMLFPELLRKIKEADSEINLHIYQQPACEPLHLNELLISSAYQKPTEHNSTILLEERILAAVPKGHRLSGTSQVTLQDLKSENFISLTPHHSLSSIIQHYCGERLFSPQITTCVDTPSLMRDLLRQGMGIAFVPELTWKGFASDRITMRPVSDFPMKRYITLSWNPDAYLSPALLLCREIITAYFHQM